MKKETYTDDLCVCGVYLLQNIVSGSKYVGSSRHIRNRYLTHKSRLNNGRHENKKIQADFDELGWGSFSVALLKICGSEELASAEQYFINLINPDYNIARLAYKSRGIKRGEKTIERMRKANIGKRYSKEVNLKKGRKGELSPNYGKGRPVIQFDLYGNKLMEFLNCNDAGVNLGVNASNIRKCCKKIIHKSYGYKWEYAT